MANVTLTPEVRAVLASSTITGNQLALPGRLESKLYEAVNKALVAAGGKWNRSAKAHVFDSDPREVLGLALETGFIEDEQQKFQAFYTPPHLAAQMVEQAEVGGHIVLEPSAGEGALVKECIAQGAKEVQCIELNSKHIDALKALSTPETLVAAHCRDFLDLAVPHVPFHRIVMNPPFGGPTGRDSDIEHIEHALKFLAPGGILVALLADNFGRKRFQQLTAGLDELSVSSEQAVYWFTKVPPNTFADTPIRTVILKVKLPAVETPESPSRQPVEAPMEPTSEPPPGLKAFRDKFAKEQAKRSAGVPPAAPMSAPVRDLSRDDVLTSYALEPVRTVDTLMRYQQTWPNFCAELAQLHADLLAASPSPSPGDAGAGQTKAVTAPQTQIANMMKLTIARTELVAAMTAIKPAVATKTEVPVLSNVLIHAEQPSTIIFTGTDTDRSLLYAAEGTVDAAGATTVRAALLHDIAKGLGSAENDTVAIQLDDGILKVQCGAARFELATIDAGEFPPVPEVTNSVEFDVDQSALFALLKRTAFATSNDEQRFVLNGAFLEMNGKLNVAHCDGKRLALVTADAPELAIPAGQIGGADGLEIIIPNRSVAELIRLLNPHDESTQVHVVAASNLASFEFGPIRLTSKLIEGKYVEFRKIIPKSDKELASIYRDDLLAAVERVALVSEAVRLDFTPKQITVQSIRLAGDKKEAMGNVTDVVFCSVSREASLVVSAKYLCDALSNAPANQLELYLDGHIALLKSPEDHWLTVMAGMVKGK